jgi:hypothetical protein
MFQVEACFNNVHILLYARFFSYEEEGIIEQLEKFLFELLLK